MAYPSETSLSTSTSSSTSRDDTLAEYVKLSSQQDELRRRLSIQIPPTSNIEMSPVSLSPTHPHSSSTSFTHPGTSYPYTASPDSYFPSNSPYPLAAYPTPVTPHNAHRRGSSSSDVDVDVEDRNRLQEVNQAIKATLTDLLNTETGKHDDRFRSWCQERLMDAEMEMRKQRARRRSSASDREMAVKIAGRLF